MNITAKKQQTHRKQASGYQWGWGIEVKVWIVQTIGCKIDLMKNCTT